VVTSMVKSGRGRMDIISTRKKRKLGHSFRSFLVQYDPSYDSLRYMYNRSREACGDLKSLPLYYGVKKNDEDDEED